MKRSEFNEVQKEELRRLIDLSGNDPLFTPQLQRRLEELEAARVVDDDDDWVHSVPRAAIFIHGGGVTGVKGIRPQLAGEALTQYERMYVEQAIHDERQARKDAGHQRRAPGTPAPALLFTGTPRGSFGLEFVPVLPAEDTLRQVHAAALQRVSDSIVLVAASGAGDTADTVEDSVPATVLQPMKMFIKALVRYDAELRLVSGEGQSREIKPPQLAAALDRLNRTVAEDEITIKATLQGVTLLTGHFNLTTEADELIDGEVGSEVPESDIKRFHELTGRLCSVILRKRTVSFRSRLPEIEYFLLKAFDLTTAAGNPVPKTK